MLHLRSLEELSPEKTWLTIGVFDGVHRGHQEIINHLRAGAKEAKASALVISFSPHPAVVLGKRKDLKYLTLPDEKAELIEGLGVDILMTHPFNQRIAALSAEEFMAEIQARVKLEKFLIGYDFALGKDRQGDAEYLTALGQKAGYKVQTFGPVVTGDEAVSSSRIRAALAEGRVRDAIKYLGRPYALSGSVIHGDGRGRKINIPTANIETSPQKAVPLNGVYACWAYLHGEKHRAVTNIGIRPTFTPDKEQANIETHLLDFKDEIYGESLKLEFISRLRDEKKFASVDELLVQIRADIAKANDLLK
ncbi:MAG: bifunctional riboflavin kinase/FAD synthetase [Anaerolineales bacterium]|nr:bifunctional riboflavin kinase/FAD synthetase [Anaerolineales bacterium]